MSRLTEPTERLENRTYNVEERQKNHFVCGKCSFIMWYTIDMTRKLKYCPYCGRKIILRSAYETIEKDISEVV